VINIELISKAVTAIITHPCTIGDYTPKPGEKDWLPRYKYAKRYRAAIGQDLDYNYGVPFSGESIPVKRVYVEFELGRDYLEDGLDLNQMIVRRLVDEFYSGNPDLYQYVKSQEQVAEFIKGLEHTKHMTTYYSSGGYAPIETVDNALRRIAWGYGSNWERGIKELKALIADMHGSTGYYDQFAYFYQFLLFEIIKTYFPVQKARE
jgi:hypothetical protein